MAEPALSAEAVRDMAAQAGRDLSPGEAQGLVVYLELLVRWAGVVNLVGPREPRTILATLVADSWHLADFLRRLVTRPEPLSLDLGAGAGLPGVPLRLFWPVGDYHLVEPRQKRAAFLQNCVGRLGLKRTRVVAGRVEDLPRQLVPADVIIARAFLPWPEYLTLAQRLAAPGGCVVVMANTPPPARAGVEQGFRLLGTAAYEVSSPEGPKTRYFWGFTPESSST